MGNGNHVQTPQLIQPFGKQLGNHGLVFNQDASQLDRRGPRGWQHRDRGAVGQKEGSVPAILGAPGGPGSLGVLVVGY
jgi:hypothetical protein